MMLTQLSLLAATESEEVLIPVLPDNTGEIVWTAIFFFGLWILMKFVLLPPLLKVRAQRSTQVLADQEAAAQAEQQAEQVRRDYDATIAEARAKANEVVEAARAEAEAERAQRVGAVEAEIAEVRRGVLEELNAERRAALGGIKDDVTAIAVVAASKVVQSDIDTNAARERAAAYVDKATER